MFEAFTHYQPKNDQEKADHEVAQQLIKTYDTALFHRHPVAHFTTSSLIVSPDYSQICLIYHRLFNSWSWTGGHLDGNPDFLAVALKEAREETGLTELTAWSEEPVAFSLLPVFGHLKNNAWVSAHIHLNLAYLLIGSPEEALIANLRETKGVQWFARHELAKIVTEPELFAIYQQMLQQLNPTK